MSEGKKNKATAREGDAPPASRPDEIDVDMSVAGSARARVDEPGTEDAGDVARAPFEGPQLPGFPRASAPDADAARRAARRPESRR